MGDQDQPDREFTPEQRLFVCLELEKGSKFPQMVKDFTEKWPGKKPPTGWGPGI
jgi:hypothetical protein